MAGSIDNMLLRLLRKLRAVSRNNVKKIVVDRKTLNMSGDKEIEEMDDLRKRTEGRKNQ